LTLDRVQLATLAALAATIPLSIFASQLLLWLSIAVLVARLAVHRARLVRTPLDTPLLALVVWTLLAASFAQDPVQSHEDSKKLLLFALFYVGVVALGLPDGRERVLSSALLGGLALAGLMVAQHLFLGYDRLERRPSGFLGHYMSASGVTMAVFLLAAARLALGPRARPRLADLRLPAVVLAAVAGVAAAALAGHGVVATRLCVGALAALAAAVAISDRQEARSAEAALPLFAAPICAWALLVSQTRSAWAGALVGLAVILVLRAPRLLWLLAAGAVAVVLVRPASVASRLTVQDESSRDRYYMWQAGVDMVLDKPVFGQGPGMILAAYPRYRWPEAPNPRQPHLHNNLLEVAVERGLPGLAFFLWWSLAALGASLREARRCAREDPGALWIAGGVLGALAAVFVAGLFEYNLGDSEVLMLFLLLTAVPFALPDARPAVA
jgi:O-antigen ligase